MITYRIWKDWIDDWELYEIAFVIILMFLTIPLDIITLPFQILILIIKFIHDFIEKEKRK